MSEEAGFIAALLDEPTDRIAMLVYADWLDDRDDRRAAYLRRMAVAEPDKKLLENFLVALGQWAVVRGCGVGAAVRITFGAFLGRDAEVVGLFVKDHRIFATVRLVFWGQPMELELYSDQLEPVAPV